MKKKVGSTDYRYYYAGGKLMRMTIGSGITMDFFYDQNGQPYAMKYNNQLLYYVLNQQGDVVRIVNSSGTSYGIYTYDAWGNIRYTTDSPYLNNNPLRYRGYVYDTECNLYYLQSRYYDPAIGRFINADALASTGQGILGNNMFAYCGNNPINCLDYTGTVAIGAFLGAVVGGAIAGSVISTVSYVVGCGLNGQSISREGIIDAAKSGAISGAIGGAIGTISIGPQIVSTVQKIIPKATSKALTIGTKALASIGAGIALGNGETQQEIITTSAIASTFLGSLIDATTGSFFGSAFCNYAATLFVGTAVEVFTVAIKQAQASSGAPQIPHQASRAISNLGLIE